jgi:ABC-type multidrug transport system fused ATPase/permease subunit
MFNFTSTYSILELWVIWLGVFVGIRYGAYHIFHRNAVHRGIFHSLLAALFFMAATAVICAYGLGLSAVVSWMAGLFVFFGFLIHLILDEVYSVDFTGARIKRSFGSALKLFEYGSPSSSALMAGALLALLLVSPPSAEFRSIIEPSQVNEFFRQRMLPQNGWFKGRTAQAEVTVSDVRQSGTDVR